MKRFERPPLRRQMQRWWGGHWWLGTAGIEWKNARQLADAGIAAADPIAFGQQMAGPWEQRSFILLKQVRGVSLERWLPEYLPAVDQETDWQSRRRRLDKLARFVADFHRAGFVHRDLYLSHVFIEEEGSHNETRFCLIDLQRVFRPRWRHRRWVVKDLAALHFSTPAARVSVFERLRFLCRYARDCPRFGSVRRLAGLIETKARRMAGHNERPRVPRRITEAMVR
jgi:hypothetical protein